MDAQRFTRLVQEAAAVDEGHARNAIAATLRALGERLDAGEARQVAARLPGEIAGWIGPHGPAEAFDVDEFIRRVAEREAVDTRTAERDVRAVFTALGAAVPAEEIDDLAAQLPKGFAPLLPRGPDVAPLAADELARRVARRAGTEPDRGARALDVVLETLAERIASGELDELAARLPLELHPPLRRGAEANGNARAMPVDQFLARIAERERVSPAEALVHARAVFATLREAVGDEEFFDLTAQLPPEYARVLLPDHAHRGG